MKADATKVLETCALFADLSAQELKKIGARLKAKELGAKQPLFDAGEASRSAYVVVEGELGVRCHIVDEKQGEAPFMPVIAKFGPGEVIGEFALLDSQPRSADVFALRPSRLLVFEAEALEELAGTDPSIAYRLMRNLARVIVERLRRTNEKWTAALEWNWKSAGFDQT